MKREIQYTIGEQEGSKSISTFLKEKEYSRGILIELKKTKMGIRKNGVWACVNEILNNGDILEICLNEEGTSGNIVPIKGELKVLYEDEDILVVDKPYDTPIHPSVNNYANTLANNVAYYFKSQNRPYVFRCINRLDRDTTGITIIAKNMISASILSKQMKERRISRTYIAFVEGIVDKAGVIDLSIGRAEDSIIKRQVDQEKGKRAVTHYHRIDVFEVEDNKVSIVALRLETGRTHQIRVHMSYIGHPLLGDFLYNENNHMLERQGLHAVEIEFYHPVSGEGMQVFAALPEDMENLIPNLKGYDLSAKLREISWA